MDAPIRTLGEHPVRIRLHASVIAVVPVKVISDHQPEEEEVVVETASEPLVEEAQAEAAQEAQRGFSP